MAALTLEDRMNRAEQERRELEEAQRRAEDARRQAEAAASLEKEERERRASFSDCSLSDSLTDGLNNFGQT
jgi:hypothetical protein